ncbi:MAG: hypothetical protein J07HX64_01427 [halophilic archaeon J07HX64]|nr:MAG: hypothetical protein J07HX64_01427 [halophilic archaeon J07HX64]
MVIDPDCLVGQQSSAAGRQVTALWW